MKIQFNLNWNEKFCVSLSTNNIINHHHININTTSTKCRTWMKFGWYWQFELCQTQSSKVINNGLTYSKPSNSDWSILSIRRSSSGVNWTGSSVNSGGKFVKSRSFSNLGWNGGITCFCSNFITQIEEGEIWIINFILIWHSISSPFPNQLFWRIDDLQYLRNHSHVDIPIFRRDFYLKILSVPKQLSHSMSVVFLLLSLESPGTVSPLSFAEMRMNECFVSFLIDINWDPARHSQSQRYRKATFHITSHIATHPKPTSPR